MGYNWIVKNINGTVYAFKNKPTNNGNYWISDSLINETITKCDEECARINYDFPRVQILTEPININDIISI